MVFFFFFLGLHFKEFWGFASSSGVWVLSCLFVTRYREGREVVCYGCKVSVIGVGRGGAAAGAVAMEIFYYIVFALQILVLAALEFSKSRKDRITTSPAFNAFKNNYILVFSLMMGMMMRIPLCSAPGCQSSSRFSPLQSLT